MKIRLENLKDDQQLLGLIAVVIAVGFLIFFFLQTRAEGRPSVQGEEQLRTEIQAMERDIAEMSQMESLDSVETYWVALFDTAARSGLELKNARVAEDKRYRGPLQSRTGILEGDTAVVLATLNHLHQKMPLFLYAVKIEGHMTEVTISVVGV